jgi:hypothetical protein
MADKSFWLGLDKMKRTTFKYPNLFATANGKASTAEKSFQQSRERKGWRKVPRLSFLPWDKKIANKERSFSDKLINGRPHGAF